MPREKKEKNLDAMVGPSKAVAVRTDQLKLKRRLTMDATSLARLGELFCQTTGELELIDMPAKGNGNEPSKAWAIPVLDLEHGTNYLLICNKLMVSGLKRSGEPLAGKYFAMKAGEIRAGKAYRHCEVFELELAE